MNNKMNGLSCRMVMVAVVLGGLPLLVGCRSNPAPACHPGMQTARLFVLAGPQLRLGGASGCVEAPGACAVGNLFLETLGIQFWEMPLTREHIGSAQPRRQCGVVIKMGAVHGHRVRDPFCLLTPTPMCAHLGTSHPIFSHPET